MKRWTLGFAVLVVLVGVGHVEGGLILQDESQGRLTIWFFSPAGQTFTAEDANIASIGFGLSDVNDDLPNLGLTVNLYEGIGTGGFLLGSDTMIPTSGLHLTFVDFDFRSAGLKSRPMGICQQLNQSALATVGLLRIGDRDGLDAIFAAGAGLPLDQVAAKGIAVAQHDAHVGTRQETQRLADVHDLLVELRDVVVDRADLALLVFIREVGDGRVSVGKEALAALSNSSWLGFHASSVLQTSLYCSISSVFGVQTRAIVVNGRLRIHLCPRLNCGFAAGLSGSSAAARPSAVAITKLTRISIDTRGAASVSQSPLDVSSFGPSSTTAIGR